MAKAAVQSALTFKLLEFSSSLVSYSFGSFFTLGGLGRREGSIF